MRVLMVTTSFPRWPGDSAGHFVASLAQGIAALGHQVVVLAPHEGDLPVAETVGDVRVERFRYLPAAAEQVAYGAGIVENLRHRPLAAVGLPFFTLALRRRVRRMAPDYDIVHVHWAPTAALAGVERLPVPYVLKLHGSDVTLARGGGIWRRLLGRALRSAAAADVVARTQRDFMLQEGLWDESRPLAVIPAGIPDELLERPPVHADGRFEFVFVGRLISSKGILELLDAFRMLVDRDVDAVLHVVGTGPLAQEISGRVAAAGLDDRVRMSGHLDHADALDAIAAADALVLPSHGEGSPLVVAEALALGTPVIGTRVGAIPDLLGADGLVVAPQDPAELADAMVGLATDSELHERLAAQGRERARRHLRWTSIAQETVALYRAAGEAAGPAADAPEPSRLQSLSRSAGGRAAKALLLLVLLYFIARALATPISQVDLASLRLDLPLFLLSVLLLTAYYALFSGGLTMLYRLNGSTARYTDVFKLSFTANLGKYLPGGFWPVAARVAMASRIRIRRRTTILLSIIESAVSVTAACLVIVAAHISPGSAHDLPDWTLWSAIALAGALLIGIHPAVLKASSGVLERVLGTRIEPLPMSYTSTIGLIGYYSLTWLVAGAAFRTLVQAIAGEPGAGWLSYSAYFAFGAVVGLLVLFAPGGIGAREGALLLALSGPLGAPVAALISVVARLWSTLVELVLSGTAVLMPYSVVATGELPAEETRR